jgi:hypothetical protein
MDGSDQMVDGGAHGRFGLVWAMARDGLENSVMLERERRRRAIIEGDR